MKNRQQRQSERTPEKDHEDTDSSSDSEYEVTHSSYGQYLQKLFPKPVSDESADDSQEDQETPAHDQEGVVSVPNEVDNEVLEESENSGEDLGELTSEERPYVETEDDFSNEYSSESDNPDFDPDQKDCTTPVGETKTRSSTKRESELCLRPRSKRHSKPVIRLTYDEPGKARDQPITIVHKGVIIKLGY